MNVTRDLTWLLPGLNQLVPCPACVEDATCGCGCGMQVNQHTSTVSALVQHLNDRCRWTREQIADWLETLDVDLEFPTEPPPRPDPVFRTNFTKALVLNGEGGTTTFTGSGTWIAFEGTFITDPNWQQQVWAQFEVIGKGFTLVFDEIKALGKKLGGSFPSQQVPWKALLGSPEPKRKFPLVYDKFLQETLQVLPFDHKQFAENWTIDSTVTPTVPLSAGAQQDYRIGRNARANNKTRSSPARGTA